MIAPDLTAQLAALVREAWRAQHEDYYHCPCDGDAADCPAPKAAALVAYEQAPHAETKAIAAGWCAAGAHEWQPATTDRRRQVCAKCPTWQWRHDAELPNPLCSCPTCNDLRADGAGEPPDPVACVSCGESQTDCLSWPSRCCSECRHREGASYRAPSAPQSESIAPSKPALAYVLTRGDADAPDSQQLHVYTSEAAEHAANHDRAVLQQFDTAGFTYRVHAVPRVE